MYYVYILYSKQLEGYYIGQTVNVEKRLREHNEGKKKRYTTPYRPWEMYWFIKLKTRSASMRLEKYLKKKSRKFISRLRNDDELQNYIKVRFDIPG